MNIKVLYIIHHKYGVDQIFSPQTGKQGLKFYPNSTLLYKHSFY